ncbi:peptidase M13 [Mycetocola tolaasinivorans]|uniref:Peptidase M13 n=1 Tax=Mycetocola tolaasinivorans TaxID=76635 RepID=A0A3L6ZZ16_9MICO|nr:M13-type metalloendopeptidase [Mycetocola tolaasinivorans]RLP72681.1 peptidase M13 [Mycetocola tolaasinivorans]
MTSPTPRSGIALDDLNPDIRPQDDLYRHTNGRWLERTEIPADKSRWGSFSVLAEEAEEAVRTIIEDSRAAEAGTTARKVGDLYTSFLAEERIEALGATPLAGELARVDAIATIADFARVSGELDRAGVGGFFGLWVDNDPGNPERYLVMVQQSGISLPDESYFREERFAAIREAYLGHIERLLALAGLDAAAERAARVFDLETRIAAAHWDNVAARDSQAQYNLLKWPAVRELFAGAGDVTLLDAWAAGLAAPDGALAEVVVRQPSFVEGIAALLTTENLDAWTDWLRWKIIHGGAAYLSTAFVEENFDFYGRTLSGVPEIRERWKRGVSLVEGLLGEAVGQEYVARHFPAESKSQMDVLVKHLEAAYQNSISALEWMGPETRERALEKLSKFTPKIGFPDRWRDYSNLVVSAGDLVANIRAGAAFEFDRELAKIGKPIDRDEWFMTPQTINAYYNPGFNEIVFPAAILQYPFFDAGRDAAANYGAIGAVIGHEIGHGFDDQGSRYDGDGKLTDWWTEADRAAFEERTTSLIEQYNALAPAQVPDHHVNGALTIGENIGDLGGLSIAWQAYLLSLEGVEPEVIDGLTGAQRFFLSWAQAWAQLSRDEEAIRLLATDPHSPNEFRCNQIVRNIDEFYTAFDVREGDALWLAPAQRVTIW